MAAAVAARTPLTRTPRQTLQRQVLADIREGPPNQIADVIIGGRTPSPFTGTMGAHGTAWVGHVDQVRRRLIGAELPTAANQLIALALHEQASPLLDLLDDVPEAQRTLITNAKAAVDADIAALQVQMMRTIDPASLLQRIKKLVDSHMTYVNYLPGATVSGGDPSGHGEGSARVNLNFFEYLSAKPATSTEGIKGDKFSSAVKREALRGFAPPDPGLKRLLIQELWVLFAAETPGVLARTVRATTLPLTIWTAMLKSFLTTIKQAYPYAYAYTEMHTPASQVSGLDHALQSALVGDGDFPRQAVFAAIRNGLDAVPAAPVAAAAGPSDLAGGASGFQSSVFLDGDAISDVQMIGRTRSPFSGTMGRHTTAWIAHVDAVRARLIGKTLDNALNGMLHAADQLLSNASLDLVNLLDEKQLYWVGAWHTALKARAAQVRADLQGGDALRKTPQAKVKHLEALVLEYMSLMNLLPFSTINHGSIPDGRNEGRHREFLRKYEVDGNAVFSGGTFDADQLLVHLLGLWDGGPLDDVEAERANPQERQVLEQIPRGHDLWKPIRKRTFHEQRVSMSRRHALTFNRFLHTVTEAYPTATQNSGVLALTAEAVNQKLEDIANKGQATPKRKGDDKHSKRPMKKNRKKANDDDFAFVPR